MHYGTNGFSKNGKPTLRSIKDPARVLGQRKGFTQIDIQEINSLYECGSKSSDFTCFKRKGRLLFIRIPCLLRNSKQRFPKRHHSSSLSSLLPIACNATKGPCDTFCIIALGQGISDSGRYIIFLHLSFKNGL